MKKGTCGADYTHLHNEYNVKCENCIHFKEDLTPDQEIELFGNFNGLRKFVWLFIAVVFFAVVIISAFWLLDATFSLYNFLTK